MTSPGKPSDKANALRRQHEIREEIKNHKIQIAILEKEYNELEPIAHPPLYWGRP